ncbi:MFS transporter [Bombilactobacillus thymidiniphilus]|uniref:MFS transporter n=1 Tax=Bombilactobacillus thymidiniphilus TaxID=2923363 RepID=A0ABY4PEC6_9LACO|nr:MFS transporter [Bombilactobacillus thymidiniphilus]UQS84086.1 MFS transporter [Bombilactobacillus thymidiniphilus]
MKKKYYAWMSVGIILIAANLRLPITMIPPILPWLHQAIGLPNSLSGLLTTIPLLMFAILSPFIARWGTRKGNTKVLFVTLLILVIGSYLRAIPSSCVLILGTVLVGMGISGGNVLLPAVIQEYFPAKATLLTSLYTFTMGFVAAFGTGVAAPLVKATNLTITILVIACISLLSFLVWAYVYHGVPKERTYAGVKQPKASSISHYSLTWLVTFCFGTQSLLYYSLLTVLPSFWTSNHFSTGTSSLLATVFQLSGMPMSLLTPILASTKKGMYATSVGVGGIYAAGAILLPIFHANFVVNLVLAILMGMASATAFSLCIVFFQKKTAHVQQTAQLSGVAQSAGYLFAAIGPALSVYVYHQINNWAPIFMVYAILSVFLLIAAVIVTRKAKMQ